MVGLSKLAVRCCCVKRHTLFFSYNIEGYRIALLKEHCSRGERRSSHCCCVVFRHAILYQMWLVSSSCWWHGVCSCSNCDCLALSSVCGALIRSSSCLAAGYNSNGVVKLVGGTVQQLLCLKVTAR